MLKLFFGGGGGEGRGRGYDYQPVQPHYGFRNLYYTAVKTNVVACSKAEICAFNLQYYKSRFSHDTAH